MSEKNYKSLLLLLNCARKMSTEVYPRIPRTFSKGVSKSKETPLVTPVDEARRFMIDCFKTIGCSDRKAGIVANNLVEADYRGHYSHGMNRLEMYIMDVERRLTSANATPIVEKETIATAVVNAKNGFGAVSGKFCMDLAIKKAEEAGIAIVTCNNANHYGIAGMYALQAIQKGYIGFSCTNTSPLMVPTRAKKAALGTNPVSLGVPGTCNDSFLLDFATTAVAVGKIELKRRKGKKIPKNWALNEDGKFETDAAVAVKAGRLLPLGGPESNSGYKGYGFGMLVEIFCGILSGSHYGPNIRSWTDPTSIANLGQCFIALKPDAFAPGVTERMSDLMCLIRKMEPANPKLPVLIHGDLEREHMEKVRKDGGLLYVKNQHDTNAKLAERLKIPPMKSGKSGGDCQCI